MKKPKKKRKSYSANNKTKREPTPEELYRIMQEKRAEFHKAMDDYALSQGVDLNAFPG